jgi:alpha-mannosidase
MSGVMTDRVYEDTLRGYDFAQRIATDETNVRLRDLTACIDTRGEGTALAVFNSLSWARTDLVLAGIGFSASGVRSVKLVGPNGQPVPVQILKAHRYPDGAIAQAEIAFVAQEVPALGHAVYRILPGGPEEPPALASEAPVLENEFYRLECDPATGAIASLIVKAGGWNALDGPGNVVALEEDRGDLWELYKTLDGGSRIAMRDRHPAPKPGQARFSTDWAGAPGAVACGPVLSEFVVSHPFGAKGSFKTTIRLYAGLPRIDVRTQLVNGERNVRYRVLFPTSIRQGQSVHEIPFGAIARPDGIEFPAQNWIDYSDGERGVALLNRGLPGNNVADGVMLLSLLRSVCIAAYGFGGGYEPGMSSDSGFEEGRELTFDYALQPHPGGWQAAGIQRAGMAFNQPLLAVTAAAQRGRLPPRWGLLEIGCAAVLVSALKRGADNSAVLRMYEATGRPANGVAIKPSFCI